MIDLSLVYQDLKGKVAVVTGAGSGIGKAIAKELARQNMYVAMLDIHEGNLQETFNEILLELGNSRDYNLAAYFLCDVTSEEQVAKMVCFLASSYASGNTTGQILRCDSGQLMM